MRRVVFVSSLVSGLVLACSYGCVAAGEPGGRGGHEPTGQPLEESTSTGHFLVTRRDVRRCAAPFCGGWFVKLVNRDETPCADGSSKPECYVSEIDLERLNLSEREVKEVTSAAESGRVIVEGRMIAMPVEDVVLGKLVATSAWMGVSGSKPTGTFYRAADNGLRCVRAPCPSTTAWALNMDESRDVTDVIITRTEVSPDPWKLRHVQAALTTEEGALVAGTITEEACETSPCRVALVASEAYLRVVPRDGKPASAIGADRDARE